MTISIFNRYLLKLQSEELQIHATEITAVRKSVEREKMFRQALEQQILPHKKTSNRKHGYQTDHGLNGTTNNTLSEKDEGGSSLFQYTAPTTELPSDGIDKGKEKDAFINYARELTVQHKTTISEVSQLRTKITESLGEHRDMKRSIDELKTEVLC